jgi:hypothetical protein
MKINPNSAAALIQPSLEYHIVSILGSFLKVDDYISPVIKPRQTITPDIQTHLEVVLHLLKDFEKEIYSRGLIGRQDPLARRLLETEVDIATLRSYLDDLEIDKSEVRQLVNFCLEHLEQIIEMANDIELECYKETA